MPKKKNNPKQDTKLQINKVHWLWSQIIFVESALGGSKLSYYDTTSNGTVRLDPGSPVAWIAVPLHLNCQVCVVWAYGVCSALSLTCLESTELQ